MKREMLINKIHRARVTDANLDYEGSVAIDTQLMETAGILPFEKVHIFDVTNGSRFVTYAIEAERGSGEVCINGAAAHLAKKDDVIIIATYGLLEEHEAKAHSPVLVYVDDNNSITRVGKTIAGRV